MSARRTALTAVAAVGALGAAAATWGVGIERYLFTVRSHRLAVLPAGAPGMRVLHLSDAHMAPWQHRKQEWMARLVDLKPDLVINTGDNLGHTEGLRGLRLALGSLRGIPGAFVHGSNDHTAPSFRNPVRYFTGPSQHVAEAEPLDAQALDGFLRDDLGWVDLNNAVARVEAAGIPLDLFGVSDAHRRWDRLDSLSDPLAELQSDGRGVASFGVTHAPYRRVLDRFTDLGADVIFAGHTHGGQVRVPGYGALVANCDIPLRQARGLSSWTHGGRSAALNVSAGLGHSIYAPVRFACRPEASLLTLVSQEDDPGGS